jgi:hypothetical protein
VALVLGDSREGLGPTDWESCALYSPAIYDSTKPTGLIREITWSNFLEVRLIKSAYTSEASTWVRPYRLNVRLGSKGCFASYNTTWQGVDLIKTINRVRQEPSAVPSFHQQR